MLLLFTCLSLTAQVPNGINYQAILRDNSNNEIINEPIEVKFGLITDSPAGTLIWEEQQSAVTNDFGLFGLIIGDDLATRTGGTHADYTDIIWGAKPMYLKVSIFYDDTWKDFDPQLINSTPFALVSKSSEDDEDTFPDNELIETLVLNGTTLEVTEGGDIKAVDLSSLKDSPFTMNADTVTLIGGSISIGAPNPGRSKVAIVSQDDMSEDALFEVKRSDGQTIFAVYNEGVRIFLPTDPVTKGPKGGFAIGGFDNTKGDYTEDYLWVTPDSIRMYIDKTPDGKGPKGGFAIGGFDRTKAIIDEYMVVNGDSTRFYIDNTSAKGPKGGFAIGGFDNTKGNRQDYMMINNDSTRFYIDDTGAKGPKGGFAIGGFDNTKGSRQDYMRVTMDSTRFFVNDSIAGFGVSDVQSGTPKSFMRMDKQNSYIGHESGVKAEPEAIYNSFIGYQSGTENLKGRKNVFVGYRAGYNNNQGHFNIFIGNESGQANNSGGSNLFIGNKSGNKNNNGNDNVFLGISAGLENYDGSNNTFIGPRAGRDNTDGGNNVYIGFQSGGIQKGSGNVLIGANCGLFESQDMNNALLIDNSSHYFEPLVTGSFSAQTFHINGTLTATEVAKSSDIGLKKDIENLTGVIDKIMLLNPVSFYYIQENRNSIMLSDKRQYGLIAQELENVFPDLVGTDNYGYKTIDYMNLFSLLIPAVQDMKEDLDVKDQTISEMKRNQDEMVKMIQDLQTQISQLNK